jgi:ABC-type multidrug transport system fused ATPase/permease subunit
MPDGNLVSSDVSFAYPQSKSTRNALNGVSFSVNAGQLVVIVGANGSGKSTLVKLLGRLFQASSGEILIDGHEMDKYQIPHLRQATAILTQDHNLFPLSVSENIGLGHPNSVSDSNMVIESAKLGGSYDFISKLTDGFETVLHPVKTGYSRNMTKGEKSNLHSEWEKVEKSVEVSGAFRRFLSALVIDDVCIQGGSSSV